MRLFSKCNHEAAQERTFIIIFTSSERFSGEGRSKLKFSIGMERAGLEGRSHQASGITCVKCIVLLF